jgi:hypothetical protein
VAGPYDSPARCREIIAILLNHCGPDQFEYVIPFGDDDFDDEVDGYIDDEGRW